MGPSSAVYRYQFRSAAFGETDELRSGPLRRKWEEAIADLIASLNIHAHGLTGYSAMETRRWLQGKGIDVWDELIPKELQDVCWLAGWAKSFLTAGAGAFIGSLWEVRDTSASRFAEEFYQALFSDVPL